MSTRYPETLIALPDVPKEFGEDGGYFNQHYDQLANEIDDDLLDGLKATLDSILIFAGLFAGVNSTFLAFMLPQMSANPADDTNALLLQILLGGNSTIRSAADLPSASFMAPSGIYLTTLFFSMSLGLALASAFLAMLGQQWIACYRKWGGGGSEYQRWEQLRRSLGADRWRLKLVLGGLIPGLLHLGLVMFCAAFTGYLRTLDSSLGFIPASMLYTAWAGFVAMAICTAFDPWCPFKLSVSNSIFPTAAVLFGYTPHAFAVTAFLFHLGLWAIFVAIPARVTTVIKGALSRMLGGFGFYKRLKGPVTRSAKHKHLMIEAIRRVMCISENRTALVYAAMNLQTIREHGPLLYLIQDKEFCTRLFALCQTAVGQVRHQRPNSHAMIEARAFSASLSHLWLSAGSFCGRKTGPTFGTREEIIHLSEGVLLPFTTDCDQCSHCTTLLFSMRIVGLLTNDSHSAGPSFDDAFEDVEGALTRSDDLRLGCVVASAILCSKNLSNAPLAGLSLGEANSRRSKLFEELFTAYRAKSECQMAEVVNRGLATVESDWTGRPDHELYVRLFELGISTEEGFDKAHSILHRLGSVLLSIEIRIRDAATSATNEQRGREHQNRCVQSVVRSLEEHSHRKLGVWLHVGPSLEPYLKAVKLRVETDPENPKNPATIDLLKSIHSSFPRPAKGGGSTPVTSDIMYSKFCELLDQIETVFQKRNNVASEEAAGQSTGIFSGDADEVESTGTVNARHAQYTPWGN